MNNVTIPLTEYAKKVEETIPKTWILIYADHNDPEYKVIDGNKGFFTNDLDIKFGAGTNNIKGGMVMTILQAVLEKMKGQFNL